jgi:fumarate reductase subunit C
MLLKILILVIGWFVIGFIINLLCYAGKPEKYHGKSQTAKSLHVVVNIITLLLFLGIIFE